MGSATVCHAMVQCTRHGSIRASQNRQVPRLPWDRQKAAYPRYSHHHQRMMAREQIAQAVTVAVIMLMGCFAAQGGLPCLNASAVPILHSHLWCGCQCGLAPSMSDTSSCLGLLLLAAAGLRVAPSMSATFRGSPSSLSGGAGPDGSGSVGLHTTT